MKELYKKLDDCKAIILWGDKEVSGVNRDGTVEYIEKSPEEESHMEKFLDLVRNKYGDDPDLRKLGDLELSQIMTMLSEFAMQGHAVFVNITSHISPKKDGLLFVPNKITENQYKEMQEIYDNSLADGFGFSAYIGFHRDNDKLLCRRFNGICNIKGEEKPKKITNFKNEDEKTR